jgi:hypothetical protein
LGIFIKELKGYRSKEKTFVASHKASGSEEKIIIEDFGVFGNELGIFIESFEVYASEFESLIEDFYFFVLYILRVYYLLLQLYSLLRFLLSLGAIGLGTCFNLVSRFIYIQGVNPFVFLLLYFEVFTILIILFLRIIFVKKTGGDYVEMLDVERVF